MSDHPTPPASPPPRRIVVLQTTTDILNETTSIFFSTTTNNLLMFLLLFFYYFSQLFQINFATHALTSYIDNQPSIKSFFSPIPNSTTIRRRFLTTPQHDDFFDYRFFSTTNLPNPQSNATSLILSSFPPQFVSPNFVSDNGIRASEIVHSTSKFTIQNDIVSDEINVSVSNNQTHHFTALLFPFGVFSVSYSLLMLAFISTQSSVHGVIFVLILNEFCRKRHNHNHNFKSFLVNFLNGGSLGRMRLFEFMFLKWITRFIFTLFFGVWFFGGIRNRYSLIKILIRLILMPYSIFTPWVEGFEEESQGFVTTWLFVDFSVSFVQTLDPWILMGDPRKNVEQVVREREGLRLLSLINNHAFNLKGLESIVCGPIGRLVIARSFGYMFGIAFQAFMEVYFLVAWLLYYLSAKSVDANSSGQPFGQPELEAMLEDVDDS